MSALNLPAPGGEVKESLSVAGAEGQDLHARTDMLRARAALLPLGALRGAEALNVWEHIAFSEWLETHELLEDGARDAWLNEMFEEEAALYEGDPSEAWQQDLREEGEY